VRAHLIARFGGPEVVAIADLSTPEPDAGEVLIRVIASGLNPVDAWTRRGDAPVSAVELPFIPGWDLAGRVERTGSRARRFRPGDLVFGMPAFPQPARTHAEFVTASEDELAPIPRALDPVEAAALPLAALTAWQALIDHAHLQAGQRVLVHGAAGGVGHLAVQIARARGAEVLATARVEHHQFVRSLGAARVIDPVAEDFTTAENGLDVVFDLVGGERVLESLVPLALGGILVAVNRSTHPELEEVAQQQHRRATGMLVHPDTAALGELSALCNSGLLRVAVSDRVSFAEPVRAHALLDRRGRRGKIVLTMSL